MILPDRFAFENLIKAPKKDEFRPYIRCEYCIFSEKSDKKGFVFCKKYNMYSLIDKTCKSGEKKKNLET